MQELMDTFVGLLGSINNVVWGPIMLIVVLGTGLYLTIGLRFLSFRRIGYSFRMMWQGREKGEGGGELSPFNALMTALAATVGTGNIAGVATAIYMGGPGALFWMWCTAMVGMATKFAETVLAVKYREITPEGNYVGGPMYFIKNGLGKNWIWLATAFAVFGTFAGFGIGNMVQSNSIIESIIPILPDALTAGSTMAKADIINLSPLRVGVAITLLVLIGVVLIGGLQRIGDVAGKIVPAMCVLYIVCASIVVCMHITEVPRIFALVVSEAFSPTAVSGGAAGSAIWLAIRFGVARGVFSNEAGMGSAPIAYATAVTRDPVKMGFVGMLGTFIDTIMVCSMTGFAILVSGIWKEGTLTGSALTSAAFNSVFPGVGAGMVAICSVLFAFTTILGWCVYSERCAIYLFGDKALRPFRIIYTLAVPLGVICQLDTVWLIADTLNALMAFPNLIGLALLSPVLFKMVQDYVRHEASGTGDYIQHLLDEKHPQDDKK